MSMVFGLVFSILWTLVGRFLNISNDTFFIVLPSFLAEVSPD